VIPWRFSDETHRRDFWIACRNGDIRKLNKYVEEGCNLNTYYYVEEGCNINTYYQEIFRISAEHGYMKIIKYLIRMGYDPSFNYSEVAKLAALHGKIYVLKFLAEEQGCDLTENYDHYLIGKIAKNDDFETLRYLVSLDYTRHELYGPTISYIFWYAKINACHKYIWYMLSQKYRYVAIIQYNKMFNRNFNASGIYCSDLGLDLLSPQLKISNLTTKFNLLKRILRPTSQSMILTYI
jgi:hypothetical protein